MQGDFNNKQEEKRDAGKEKSTQSITGKIFAARDFFPSFFEKADNNRVINRLQMKQ